MPLVLWRNEMTLASIIFHNRLSKVVTNLRTSWKFTSDPWQNNTWFAMSKGAKKYFEYLPKHPSHASISASSQSTLPTEQVVLAWRYPISHLSFPNLSFRYRSTTRCTTSQGRVSSNYSHTLHVTGWCKDD
jgi:hypothetical protein